MQNFIEIRIAQADDIPGILSVCHVAWLATYPNDKYGITYTDIKTHMINRDKVDKEKWQKRIEENTSARTYVAVIQNNIIGFISASKETDENKIRAMYILPGFQNMGIGTKLMQEALTWLGDEKKITLEVVSYNKNAIEFYKKMGFVTGGPTTCEEGDLPSGKHLPEIEMMKHLSKIENIPV